MYYIYYIYYIYIYITDEIRKNIKVFETIGFQIEIETNLHEVNFLDITFN